MRLKERQYMKILVLMVSLRLHGNTAFAYQLLKL